MVTSSPVEEFRTALQSDSNLLQRVNQVLSYEISTQEEHEAELRSSSVSARLVRLIEELEETLARANQTLPARAVRTGLLKPVSLKRSEIAQILSITPAHLSRLLQRMKAGTKIQDDADVAASHDAA
jgi:CRP-like cAMP-binding protein